MRRITDAQLSKFADILLNSTPVKASYMGYPTLSTFYRISTPVTYEFDKYGQIVVVTNNNEILTYTKEVAEKLER